MLDIKINPHFIDLWQNPARELCYYGGRFGAKNYEITQRLCVEAISNKIKCYVLREFGTDTKGSVYEDILSFFDRADIKVMLDSLNVGDSSLEIKAQRITLKHNGSRFIFAGINDNTARKLKGLNNVNFVWIDEADFLTRETYGLLEPSVRAENSQIIYSMNPKSSEGFLYQRTQNEPNSAQWFSKHINAVKIGKNGQIEIDCNPHISETNFKSICYHRKIYTDQMWRHYYLGEPYDSEDGNVINTDSIGFFNDDLPQNYTQIFLSADTAYSKAESADFSAIGIFGLNSAGDIHLLRILRGRWEFYELQNNLKGAYEWAQNSFKIAPSAIIIEKKASGQSLLQELRRTTHLPLREVVPKSDKFARVTNILSEIPRLKLPQSKNPLNAWINDFIRECKQFRADLTHPHDDQVDCLVYALEFAKAQSIDWNALNRAFS